MGIFDESSIFEYFATLEIFNCGDLKKSHSFDNFLNV